MPPTPADLVAGGEFPIGVWWPPPPDEPTQQRYQEIADANFNFVIGGNGVTNDASIPDALDAAELNDLKFLLTDDPGGSGFRILSAAVQVRARKMRRTRRRASCST